MFGISQIKADLAALESKVSIDVKADIATLMARVKTLETALVAEVQDLAARVKTLETPAQAPSPPPAATKA